MRQQIFSVADDNRNFEIPIDCNIIWVSGCGGGGGGGGANSTSGATGGGASPAFFRVPLSVTPNGVLCIRVATGGLGGASGAPGQSPNTEGYKRISSVSGKALISPLGNIGYFPMLSLGLGNAGTQTAGGGGGLPQTFSGSAGTPPLTSISMMPSTVDAADWSYTAKNFPILFALPVITGDCGRSGPSNPFSFGLSGRSGWMNTGLGDESASDATYGTGGAGGGNMFGKGGAGGVYSGSIGSGADGVGYGSGGGGGSGGPGPYGAGGNGAPGIVIIEY